MRATTTLTPTQDSDLRGVLDDAAEGGQLAFLVVYGSVSRGEQRADSDLDVYYETWDEAVELEEADPDARAHVFGARSGALLESLRRGDEMAFAIVSDAVVVYDDGTFRSIVAAARRERLEPAVQ
jgi:predicted nucleotidyltransferase